MLQCCNVVKADEDEGDEDEDEVEVVQSGLMPIWPGIPGLATERSSTV